jgi:hypothetical protein
MGFVRRTKLQADVSSNSAIACSSRSRSWFATRRSVRVRMIKEHEDKFEVDSDWVMPQLTDLLGDGGRLDQEVRKLDNTYFDTPGAALRLFGITLRRRVGGSETGWQLKVPSGTARTELQSGSRAKTLPRALAKAVEGLLAGESLDPVARIVTTRTAYRLLNADGEPVLEIADDQVQSGPTTRCSRVRPMVSRRCTCGVRWKSSWARRQEERPEAGTEAAAGCRRRPKHHQQQARPGSRPGFAERAGIHGRVGHGR